jgi:hypothetical protein
MKRSLMRRRWPTMKVESFSFREIVQWRMRPAQSW